MRTIYVDRVAFRDVEAVTEMRDYSVVEHLPGWAIWRWSDETIAIPSDRIMSVETTEEDT